MPVIVIPDEPRRPTRLLLLVCGIIGLALLGAFAQSHAAPAGALITGPAVGPIASARVVAAPGATCIAIKPHVAVVTVGADCAGVRQVLARIRPGKWTAASAVPPDYITGQHCWFSYPDNVPLEVDIDATAGDGEAWAICGAFAQ